MIKQQINSSVILALSLAEQASLGVHSGILLTAPRTQRKEVIINCWERSAYMYWGYVLAKLLHPGEEDLGVSVIIRGFIIMVKPDYNRHIPNSSSQFQVLFYFIWPFTRLHFGWKSFHENTKDDEVILKEAHVDCGTNFSLKFRGRLNIPVPDCLFCIFLLPFCLDHAQLGLVLKISPPPPHLLHKLGTKSWPRPFSLMIQQAAQGKWIHTHFSCE